jgi:acyl-CoA hydrolase
MAQAPTEFTAPATEAMLEQLAERLRARNFEVLIVDDAAAAKAAVMQRIPDGAEVHSGKSKTMQDAGIFDTLMESENHQFLRKRLFKLDRTTQAREFRKLGAAPDIMLGSVQAVTEAGQLVVASASGSQIGPYGSGAGQLILVVGSQKIVPDLDTALRRIEQHVMPYEDATLMQQYNFHTKLTRLLIIESEFRPGRTTVILVRQPIGV